MQYECNEENNSLYGNWQTWTWNRMVFSSWDIGGRVVEDRPVIMILDSLLRFVIVSSSSQCLAYDKLSVKLFHSIVISTPIQFLWYYIIEVKIICFSSPENVLCFDILNFVHKWKLMKSHDDLCFIFKRNELFS